MMGNGNGSKRSNTAWTIGLLVMIAVAVLGSFATYSLGRVDKVDTRIDAVDDKVQEHSVKPMHTGAAERFRAVEARQDAAAAVAAEQMEFHGEQREFNAEQRAVNRQVLRTLDDIKDGGG